MSPARKKKRIIESDMSSLRYTHPEEDLVAFLGQFAVVTTCDKKARWRWERACRVAFVGRHGDTTPPGPYSVDRTSRKPGVVGGAADEAYREVCASSEHRYIVIPEEPTRIVFECHGSLPPLTAWQQLVGPQGLPFDITLADAELRWTFEMSREWPDLGTYFAHGTSED